MKKKKTKKLLLILLTLILLIIFLYWLANKTDNPTIDFSKEDTPVSMKLEEGQTSQKVDTILRVYNPDIILPGWGDITIKAHTKEIGNAINLYNPDRNFYFNCPECGGLLEDLKCPYCDTEFDFKDVKQNVYYLKFTVFLTDTDEELYSTNLIKPGYHIQNIELNRQLDVGDYNISILIEPYRTDMTTKCSTGEVRTVLHVTDVI